jgi:hypothetical protein
MLKAAFWFLDNFLRVQKGSIGFFGKLWSLYVLLKSDVFLLLCDWLVAPESLLTLNTGRQRLKGKRVSRELAVVSVSFQITNKSCRIPDASIY